MALLQTLPLEHLPPSHTLHIALYHNLLNAPFLHQQLLSGNTDFEYAFIDASVVRPSSLLLLTPHCPTHLPHLHPFSPQHDITQHHIISSRDTSPLNLRYRTQVLSRLHVLAAAYRAVNDSLENRLKSRNVHSEIVFALSMNNNVSCLSPATSPIPS